MVIAATQPHAANVNLTSQTLEDENLEVLGICECNIFPSTHQEGLKIRGYSLEIGEGVNRPTDGNARVAMYISENVQYTRRRDLGERSSMPQVWVEMNLPGTRKLVLGTVYRQFKEWRGVEEELKIGNQHVRGKEWLESLQDVWEGDVETLIMGDFNIDMGRKEAGRKADMQRLAKQHLEHNGWRHLLEEATRRKTKCTCKQQDSAIDWMVTNTPEKYTRAGVTWMGTGADHALVWAERSLQQGLGQRRRTRKRMWKSIQRSG